MCFIFVFNAIKIEKQNISNLMMHRYICEELGDFIN